MVLQKSDILCTFVPGLENQYMQITIMKRRLLFIILPLFCLVAIAQNKPATREVSYARHAAEEYLVARGADSNKIDLTLEEYTDHLLFFNDIHNHNFILMAREEYATLLNDQVLAFSIGAPHGKAKDNITFMHFMSYYDCLIDDMQSGKEPKEQKFDVEPLLIMPKLYGIRWCQYPMKSVYEGQDGTVLSGCGAVALGQLMMGWKWPKTVTGDFCYTSENGIVITDLMNGKEIDWESMHPFYGGGYSMGHKSLDSLLVMIGKAICSEYGEKATSTNDFLFKRALTRNFGYSQSMCYVNNEVVNESSMIHLIREEQKAGRPCIIAGGHHIFVCDGAFNDFLHLNMGWAGSYDGWYRFPVVRKSINPKSFIISLLFNIKPNSNEQELSKTVVVHAPGTLDSLLTDKECAHITHLTIEGKINGKDICLLRRMSGVVDSTNCFSWHGVLRKLDLSNTTIVRDTVPYAVLDAANINFTLFTRDKTYEFKNMTDADWQAICDKHADRDEAVRIVRQNSTYYVMFSTSDNTIGSRMFYGCDNLSEIILPKNLQQISEYAFANCTCLEKIVIPPAVPYLYEGSFSRCMSLQVVKVSPNSPILLLNNSPKRFKSVFRSCHPSLALSVDSTFEDYFLAHAHIKKENAERYRIPTSQKSMVNSGKKKSSKPQKPLDKYQKAMLEGKKVVSHYKMVNGKKVLISKEIKE